MKEYAEPGQEVKEDGKEGKYGATGLRRKEGRREGSNDRGGKGGRQG